MMRRRLDRRQFGQAAGATLAWWSVHQPLGAWAQQAKAQGPNAAEFIPGKDPRLLAHNTKVGEIETPLPLLRDYAITPPTLLFVRSNQPLADSLSLEPAPLAGWTVEFHGLLNSNRTLAAVELAALPAVERELVLQCSGNGRAFFSRAAQADGVQWQHGAMGNVRFRGATLASVLQHLGLEVQPTAKFVAMEGADAPAETGAADFEHSIPLADALERSILAWEMNGQPLPRVHGGPVRFVTPGFYGTMHVKWLRRLRFEAEESRNYHHVGRYRTPRRPITPGSPFHSNLANSDPNWNMKLKSVIFAPLGKDPIQTGVVPVRGVAWNDGTTRITAVELSQDNGQTWSAAELTVPDSPYAWHPWQAEVRLAAGKHTLQCRAIDAAGQTQPQDGSIAWNPAGYAWNGVDRVEIQVS
ncbi:MAG: sulfite oxidase [Pirellulaceae bacterium]